MARAALDNQNEIERGLEAAEFVKKEVQAL